MLTYEFVKSVVDSDLDNKIQAARDMSDKLRLHIDGIGLQKYLAKINNYENDKQFTAREKHAISNKFLTEEFLRPTDNAFNARGGSKNYKFKDETNREKFISKLVNVRDNSSLSDYIENVWFNKYLTDPNGLIFTEIKTCDDGEQKVEPCYKSIYSIRAYRQNGIFVDWVIFEPHDTILDKENPTDKNKAKEIFWAVDSEHYYLYQKSDEGLVLLEDPIDNSFSKVPAILCSNIIDNTTGWKKSPIDSQVELLDKYLVDNSVLNITQFFHNYPIPWEFIDKCGVCNGSGTDDDGGVCPSCNGSLKAERKDPTDKIELKFPEGNDTVVSAPAGFISTPIDAMNAQVKLIDRVSNIIFFSHWGTSQEKGTNETATGRFIDVQPVNNRLDKYSKSIELAHTELVNLLGKFYFPETFERAFIQYGRRYLIETPDQIWNKYLAAKKDNAPESSLDLLLSQFLESEFRENEQMFIFEMKKMKLEPFVHWDVQTVKGLGVKPIDFQKKLYFRDWINTKTMKDIIETDLDKLNIEFTVWVTTNKAIEINTNLNNNQDE